MDFNLDNFFKTCTDIVDVKNKGYVGDKAFCFNLVITELLTGIPAWKVVTLRLLDKMCRNVSFMTTGSKVPDDSFEDCGKDTANFAGIQQWLYKNRNEITFLCHNFKEKLIKLTFNTEGKVIWCKKIDKEVSNNI